jgi:type IV pilus assembly protein PilE
MTRQRGYTLLELLITVAVAGMLAALALQSYSRHQLRAGRMDAADALLEIAQAQQRRLVQYGSYADDLEILGVTGTEHGYYALTIESDGREFLATAVPVGQQSDDEECARFTLDDAGRRGARDVDNGDTAGRCWR